MRNQSSGNRRERLEDTIRNEINRYFRQELSNPIFQFVSITKVELSNDLSYSKVYWDTFNASHRGDLKTAIEKTKGKIRSKLSKNLQIRKVPALTFLYDGQFEAEEHITNLLKSESDDNSETDE